MADFQESLPVLTEADGDVVAKIGDGTTPSQQLGVDANGRISVNINDISAGTQTNDVKVTMDGETITLAGGSAVQITDGSDTLAVNTDGSINVNIVSAAVAGEVHDYDTAAAVAAAASSNHDYTVTATKTLLLMQILMAASGRFKAEIQQGPVASLATVAVFFGTGVNGSNLDWTLAQPIEVPDTSTGTVRVIRTNRAPVAQDLYSTIIGREV